MKQGKSNRINLTEGPIFSSLLRFAIPILLGSIVTQLYNVADSVIVGRFVSADALAAVSASAPVMSLINMFMIGLSTGSNVVIAQRMGAKDMDALQRSISTVAFLTLVCSAFITIAGLAVSRPLLNLLNTPQEIFSDARFYLIIVYLGTTGNLIYQMGSGALRGMGDSSWPFYFLLLCSFLNIVLDLLAVVVLKWGVPGVALATTLAQTLSGIGVIFRLNRGGYGVKVSFRNIRPDRMESKNIIGIGLPAAIQNIGNAVANLCVQSSVNFFGPTFIAANSIVNKVDDVINIPVVALSTALCTYVGQNMGLFRMDRIRKGINYSILSLTVLGAGLCGVLIGFRGIFPRVFTTDQAVIAIAADGLMIMSFQCLFHGTDRCLVNAMRGAGKSVVPMITAQFGAFSRIPLAYFLGVRTGNWHGIFWALLIASFLRSAAIAIYYYGGGWKRAVKKFEEKHRKSGET
ncbi:MAG: MATE family efflux transporter, partial [Lachnospiraceae bacterium]|nr:MATE family efflux transporter [Lachnospiraceae bacterium]